MEGTKNYYLDNLKSKQNKFKKDSINIDEKGISRRKFIRGALGATVLGLVGKNFLEILEEKGVWESLEKRGEKIKEPYNEKRVTKFTLEQEKIRQENSRIIGKTIEEQLLTQDQVVLNLETKEALRQKWKESYSPKPENYSGENLEFGKNYLGLEQAMEKMQPWLFSMKEEFRKIGISENYVYLAIPESHFKLDAFSRAKAKGPYQFIESSAKAYGLKIDAVVDFRCDPVESARACAQHLKDSYERFNNDWDLAFADYNGGFTNKYAQFRIDKKDRNYKDYLEWREKRLNNYLKKKDNNHKVKKGENLNIIARKYQTSIQKIKDDNQLKSDTIQIGQNLKIEGNKKINLNELSDSLENLNYPEKFYAILDVIKKQSLEEKFPPEKLEFNLLKVPEVDFLKDSYVIKSGDTLFGIVKNLKKKLIEKDLDLGYSVNNIVNLIMDQNNIKKPEAIQPRQKIVLRIPISESPSLVSMAKSLGVDLKKLQTLNPAVRNSKLGLPSSCEIRVPK